MSPRRKAKKSSVTAGATHPQRCGYEVRLACLILHTTSPLSFKSSLTLKGTRMESVLRLTPGSRLGSELWASRSALRAQSWPYSSRCAQSLGYRNLPSCSCSLGLKPDTSHSFNNHVFSPYYRTGLWRLRKKADPHPDSRGDVIFPESPSLPMATCQLRLL